MKPQLIVEQNEGINTLVIHVKPVPLFARAITISLAVICIFLPIAIIVLIGEGFRPGYLVMLAIFGFTARFFIRLYLWNTHGREVITFDREGLSYFCDYRYFKNGKQALAGPFHYTFLRLSEQEPDEILLDSPSESEGYLLIRGAEADLQSQIVIRSSELEELGALLIPRPLDVKKKEEILPE